MKNVRFLSLLLLICIIVTSLAACGGGEEPPCEHKNVALGICKDCGEKVKAEEKDWATEAKLDMSAPTKKANVSVKIYVDGDTVHFYTSEPGLGTGGVVKARFLAVDTPESTGKIEEWGKKASAFTKSKLETATSIIIESNDENWNVDSTGDRYLLWIWYKPQDSDTYRNLNIELLQNGLAIASNTAATRYGSIGTSAIAQAKAQKLNIQSKQPDPDFYYGDAIELDLKELRANIAQYDGKKVAFTGVVTISNNNSVYVESYDEETDMYYGMAVYCGFNLNGEGWEILTVGNEVRVVGKVSYYSTGQTYQIIDLQYKIMKPNDPSNLQKISDGNEAAYMPVTANDFQNKKITLTLLQGEGDNVTEVTKTFDFAALAMNTTVSMDGLTVNRYTTTTNEESANEGAMTLYCTASDGTEIAVRTVVLHDESGNLITGEYFKGKTISVKGMVDAFSGSYQIKVFSLNDITIK
ncbi:MAG: thermonuclease family protein [Clostridia bacterium]|nr:thermonuclease family protein [Clostridia bacterium]